MKNEFQEVAKQVKSTLTAYGLRIGDVRDAVLKEADQGFAVSFQSPNKGAKTISLYFTNRTQALLAQQILRGNCADAVPVAEPKPRLVNSKYNVSW